MCQLLPLLLAFALSWLSLAPSARAARLFSVDLSSSVRADDVLSAGPIGGPPAVEIPAASPILLFPSAAGEEIHPVDLTPKT